MAVVLLDTNVLSEAVRKRPALAVMKALRALRPEERFASEVTRYELRAGAARLDDGGLLWQRLQLDVLPLVRWLPLDAAAALAAAEIGAALRRRGETVETTDLFIAATALVHGLIVATRNVRHFNRVPGLVVENWFPG
jgi:predicted nucleic acid-binding protein